jgi:DNA-binding NtrC family response regulator
MKILVVDDEKGVCDFLAIMLKKEGYEARTLQDSTDVIRVFDEWNPQIVLLDIRMPGFDGLSLLTQIKEKSPPVIVILITAYASVESAVEAMRRGAFDYVTKPFKLEEMRLVLKRAVETYELRQENIALSQTVKNLKVSKGLIGASKSFRDMIELIRKVAITGSTVLIHGESGTGKELVAREIHRVSPRSDNPFIAVNCGALPDTLLESELFGHMKGSFTGAFKNKDGLFRAADKGTLFLDEISTASAKIQVGLLRVLEQEEITPVGATSPVHVDVRLLAATNQDLEKLVQEEKFREDLFYRINVVPVRIPPLRQRKEDIPLLVHHFLKKCARKYGLQEKKISTEAMKLLSEYDWPGNVRELENAVEREVIVGESSIIEAASLPDKIRQSVPYQLAHPSDHSDAKLSERQKQAIDYLGSHRDGQITVRMEKDSRQKQILNYLDSHSRITSRICSSIFNISQRLARRDLHGLADEGILTREGTGKKNTYYSRSR